MNATERQVLGAHLSIAGGLHRAPLEAERLGLETVQIFTRNQRQWSAPPLAAEAAARFRAECQRLGYTQPVAHASYLINLASPDRAAYRRSQDAFVQELTRCVALGIPYLVVHPGAHLGAGEAAGITRVAQALDACHVRVTGPVLTCLESTAGQGTSLGATLEQLAAILRKVEDPRRVAVCLDTCHLFAAGYDLRGRGYGRFLGDVARTVGLERVKVWHLNDSVKPCGSRVDRHAHIGLGALGLAGFRPLLRDPQWRETPMILETPKGLTGDGREWDAINLQVLRRLAQARRPGARDRGNDRTGDDGRGRGQRR